MKLKIRCGSDLACLYLVFLEAFAVSIYNQFCHTRTQLTITAHLILISDDQLGPRSGIKIMWKPAGAIVVRTQMGLNLTKLDLFMQTKSLGLDWWIIILYSDLNPIKRGSILNPILYHYIAFIRTSSNLS